MRIELLDNLTGKWAKQWIVTWFVVSVAILGYIFATTTEKTSWDLFYLGVSIVGLLCVVSLSFRKNLAGNGLGIVANIGEIVTQARHGAVGLLLAPVFYLTTHVFGLAYWAKNSDGDGNMVPKSATTTVLLVTIAFLVAGIALFPTINDWLASMGFGMMEDDGSQLFGIDFFWINIAAFIIGVTAQVSMILRYSYSWWLWIASNFVWLAVNMMTQNYIFAAQTMIYQVNAFIGLYEWYSSER